MLSLLTRLPRFPLLILLTLLIPLIFVLGFLTCNIYPKKLFAPPLTVVRVIDGDTVELSDGRHLRLRGINAPEISKHECLAVEAKDRLSALVLNQAITIDKATAVVDNFGRAVAVINISDHPSPGFTQGTASVRGPSQVRLGGILERSGLPSLSSVISRLFGRDTPAPLSRGTFGAVPEPPSDTANDATAATKTANPSETSGQATPEPLSSAQRPREVAASLTEVPSSNGSPPSSAIRYPLTAPSTDPAQVLVREGLARSALPFPSEAYQATLFTLEEAAKDALRGLWNPNACPQPTPIPPNCQIKGNIHWKKRQKLYFPPDCTGYARVTIEPKNGDRAFCSVEDAEAAGFTLSSTCEEE